MLHTMHATRIHRPVARAMALIGLGTFWFLWSLGALPSRDWRSLWAFAPLALILAGDELLVTGRLSWRAFLLALLLVITAIALGTILFFAPATVAGRAGVV